MTPPPWPARALLNLFPRRFREAWGAGWLETADWHWRRLEGVRLRRLRYARLLVADSVVAVPRAWLPGLARGARAFVPEGAEIRRTVRGLARAPAFTTAAVGSLALGVGAATAVFTVVDAVLLRPLPYAAPERLTLVWNEFATGRSRLPLSGAQVAELAAEPGLFDAVGGIWASSTTLTSADGATRSLSLGVVTPGFFDVLGIVPARGRSFEPDRGTGEPPAGVLLAHESWQELFGADPALVGSTVVLDGEPTPVIGVLPPGFVLHFPADGAIPPRLDVYGALPWDLGVLPPAQRFLRVVGRLGPGVDADAARAMVAAAGDRARTRHAELAASGDRLSTVPLHADAVRRARPALLALMAGAGIFALLATANVASLGFARAFARRREMAIRVCLGERGGGLVRLLCLESVAVGVLGAVLGGWIGVAAGRALWALRPEGLARSDVTGVDPGVLLFAGAVALLSTVLSGAVPLGVLRNRAPAGMLRGGASTPRSGAAREVLAVLSVAIGLVLVSGAALLARSLDRLVETDVGFERAGRVAFRMPLPRSVFETDAERGRLAREVESALAALPGVESVGGTSHPPFVPWANWAGTARPDHAPEAEAESWFFDHRSVTPGYFGAVGASFVEGSDFARSGRASEGPVVIVDRALAERAFPGASAVGRVLHATRYAGGGFGATAATVVGVVENMRDVAPEVASGGQVFWPFEQSARWEVTWVVRGSPEGLADRVREAVRGVDARLSVEPLGSLETGFRVTTARARFTALLGGILAVVALVLAALGIHGVVACLAEERLPELGIRRVFGASAGELVGRFVGRGVRIAAAGVALGLVGTFALARAFRSLLFGVEPTDPLTLGAVAVLFAVVAAVAALRPAVRAGRADPVQVIRRAGTG